MNDLISRAAALDAIDGMKPMQGNMEQLVMKALCWAAVKSIPIVDAAPIVRCRDCIYWKDQSGTQKWLPCCEIQTDGNWYCASGEQKKVIK